MGFCTAISCMDGRIQLPVIQYLQQRFRVPYVDTITEPGPNKILADQIPSEQVHSILQRLHLSVHKHQSVGIAIVGHHDCAGNPSDKKEQHRHLRRAVQWIRRHYPGLEVIALWVDEQWSVQELE